MFLKTASLPTNEAATVQAFADANDLSLSYKDFKGYKCPVLQFPIETMCDLLEVAPELRKRPWLFDASDDVIQCAAANFMVGGKVEIYWTFNDLEMDICEVVLGNEKVAELLDLCSFANLTQHGSLNVEIIGRNYSGEPETNEVPITVWEWVDSNGNNDADILQLFPAYLCRFGGEWLAKINVEYLENTFAR